LGLWFFIELIAQFFLDDLRPAGYFGDDSSDDPILSLNKRQQQVGGLDDLMLRILCQVLGSE
jgi:hypothetical protein